MGIAPSGISLFKVNNGNTNTISKICSKLVIKTPERRHRRCCSDAFIINFEQISHIVLMSLLLTLDNAEWAYK